MADDLLGESADYQLLRRIPGVGPIIALTILAEGGDLRRFGHHRQFLKFCGLDLSTQQSGQYRGQTRLSKFGNARLRRTLWIAGQVAIRQKENGFRHKFERYIAKDRDNPDLRRQALTAITAKMARVVHAVIKSGSDYRLSLSRFLFASKASKFSGILVPSASESAAASANWKAELGADMSGSGRKRNDRLLPLDTALRCRITLHFLAAPLRAVSRR
jgi:Transposase IS116/IS110/IS902 family